MLQDKTRKEINDARILAESIIETIAEPLIILDEKLRVVSANKAFYDKFRVSESDTKDKLIYELGNGQWRINALYELLEKIIPANRKINNFEVRHEFPYIGFKIMKLNAKRINQEGGRRKLILLAIEDITERKFAEEHLRYVSFHDTLTGLYNRAYFEEEMNRLDTGRKLPLCFIMGDVNYLKITNDVFGHEEGDRLLQKVAEMLKSSCRSEDIITRWGGDEFLILLPKTSQATGKSIAKRINKECLEAEGVLLRPNIALGVACKKNTDDNILQVIKKAEEEMYKSKVLKNRRNRADIIGSLQDTMERKKPGVCKHARRLKNLILEFGPKTGLSGAQVNKLALLATLHEIGKVSVPDSILTKPGCLSSEEWHRVKKHSETGYFIARSFSELSDVADVILAQHEHWDGTGYPNRLKGNDIPLMARILTVLDTYDTITHTRIYGNVLNREQALKELKKGAGKQFDPALIKIICKSMS